MSLVYVLPVIRHEDYSAFRRDIGVSLADTYDEWARLFSTEVAEARRQGKTVIEAIVNYSEFTRYCRERGVTPDPLVLLDYVRTQKPLGEA
jgi:hypothetical protein